MGAVKVSKLEGEACSAIAGLSLSNENYRVAVNILKERFGDTQEVIDLHYNKLINIRPAGDYVESLRKFLDTMDKHLRSLEQHVHHRSLCPKKFKSKSVNENVAVSEEVSETYENNTLPKENALLSTGEIVLMQTARTNVENPDSQFERKARVLLDSGSQRTYITESLASALNLKKAETQEIRLVTFGSNKNKVIKTESTNLKLKLTDGSDMMITANVVPNITGNIERKPANIYKRDDFKNLTRNLRLADTVPCETESGLIDILIGNDFYLDIIQPDRIEVQPGLYLLSSKLGWLLSGRTNAVDDSVEDISMLILTHGKMVTESNLFTDVDKSLPTKPDLEDFWNVETIGITNPIDQSDDQTAMKNFKNTFKRSDGRYQVTWPWRDEYQELPENRGLALGRLKSLVNKIQRNPELMERYNATINNQLNNGIIEKVDRENCDGRKHYIPHHVVITPQKTSTKLRIVYDASAKTSKEYKSLNDCLCRGPVLLNDLCGIMLRFRLYKIGIVADIEKAFHQVRLQPSDRDVTRFLWFKDLSAPMMDQNNIQEYRFCRVPFGVVSSPFLLSATIEHHLDMYETEVAEKLKSDIYMDNLVTGTDSVGVAKDLYRDSKVMFNEAKMNLREWNTNSVELKSVIESKDLADEQVTTVLGHTWDIQNDTIALNQVKNLNENDKAITKRNVLKQIASVFDPMGLLSPVTLKGKCLLQSLWKKNIEWDDRLGSQDENEWLEIKEDLQDIANCRVKRCVAFSEQSEVVTYTLVCFCDASNLAYASSIYLLQESKCSKKCDLIFAKSRLAPIKEMTIPKLELMAVLIGVRSTHFVEKQLKIKLKAKIVMSDSQCVLHWIHSQKKLPVFIENRIKEIRTHSDISFQYVNTKDNPADILSRGCTIGEIQRSNLWWNGPKWLLEPKEQWPINRSTDPNNENSCVTSEVKPNRGQIQKEENILVEKESSRDIKPPFEIDIEKYSSLTKVFRITAWCNRFVNRLKDNVPSCVNLKSEEIENAEKMWILHTQKIHFSDMFTSLGAKKPNNLTKQLGLYIEDSGILRCHGRLDQAELSEAERHPILLPSKSRFTDLVIEKRFIAIRGTPSEIISDNAKQFKLSSDTIKLVWSNVIKSKDVQNFSSNEGIKWNFIVERAPWMGGFYERLVGLVKRALRKSVGRKILTEDQLQTMLKETEAIVNSRPLTYIGDDLNSSVTITPRHFLCLNPKTGIPESDILSDDPDYKVHYTNKDKLLELWKKGEKLLNAFWNIWRNEYLLSLRERTQNKLKCQECNPISLQMLET
ncbi:uncharacterized protein LOC128221411 [Mya arenaria]|uniref:uncharacterized protein LOC128221411 n=1 Tax=Mya arenaria TaxID=6604 RepID=UPI0022E7D710|nr:uncharacterized protein LOC128221411 [Mya arenaria]